MAATKKDMVGKHDIRESWLIALVDALRPQFLAVGHTIPDEVRISCSWPSKSIRKRIGECTTTKAAKDGVHQISITPLKDIGRDVAEIVVHELIHACLPDDAGHKAPFKKAMKAIGLEGKPTATHAGDQLEQRLNAVCEKLGPYPHAALVLHDMAKKQGTRMLKLECPGCGYVVRTTAKWIDSGLPTCVCGEPFEAIQ
jgi:hypothetical protein